MARAVSFLTPLIKPVLPCLKPLKKRFVAGETVAEALERGGYLNSLGFPVIFSYAGEHHAERFLIQKAEQVYSELIKGIRERGLRADISVKPSQLGAEHKRTAWRRIWPDFYPEIAHILGEAGENRVRVWLDAEYLEMRRDTLRFVLDAFPWTDEAGVALQAYGGRECDSARFFKEAIAFYVRQLPPGKTFFLRICKGAYDDSLALKRKEEIITRYAELIDLALDLTAETRAGKGAVFFPEFATHDKVLMETVRVRAHHKKVEKDWFRFAVLGGRSGNEASHFAAQGYEVAIYLIFGELWAPYLLRRIEERPSYLLWPFRSEGKYHKCPRWPQQCPVRN